MSWNEEFKEVLTRQVEVYGKQSLLKWLYYLLATEIDYDKRQIDRLIA